MPRGKTRKRVNLASKRVIDSLKGDDERGTRYYDLLLRGFGIAVYPSGQKTFFIDYGPPRHRRRYTLGPYGKLTPEDARAEARDTFTLIRAGEDPLDERAERRGMPTVSDWVDEWHEGFTRRRRPRTASDYKRYLEIFKEMYGHRPLDKVTTADIRRGMQEVAQSGQTTANRWLAAVRSCLTSAVRDEIIPGNPALQVPLYKENPPRARVLSRDELARLGRALAAEEDPHVRAAFQILLETGARVSEALKARWADIDFEDRTWRIPSPKAGRPQVVPLPETTVRLLRTLPRVGLFIIAGRDPANPRYDLQSAWKRIRKAAKLEDVRVHDLRRTFGLEVARQSGLHVASKLLRHGDVRITEQVYAPLGIEDLRKAVQSRSKSLAKVVKFRPKQAAGGE